MNLSQILLKPTAGFTPVSISDCVLWLRARDKVEDSGGAYPDDAENIANWRSIQTPTEHNATQATAGDQPDWLATGFGGQPALNFIQAEEDHLDIADHADLDFNAVDFTLIFVGKFNTATFDGIMLKAEGGGSTGSSGVEGYELYIASTSSLRFRMRSTDNTALQAINTGDATSGNRIIVCRVDWSANSEVFLDGGTPGTKDISGDSGNISNDGKFQLGTGFNSASDSVDAEIAEVMLFRKKVPNVELNALANSYILPRYASTNWTDVTS